jgi:hypothetical protein
VAQLSTAQRALDAGDLQAARAAAEAALAVDPGNAAARQVLDRVAESARPHPTPASDAPDATGGSPHDMVDGAAWSSFEQRVRARRADRCAARAREAHARGDADAAHAALAELTELAPDDERIPSLAALLTPAVPQSPPAVAPQSIALVATDEQRVSPAALTSEPVDWSDTWLDGPRLALDLDWANDAPAAASPSILSSGSLAATHSRGLARRSHPLATAALVCCAIAAVGAAFLMTPGLTRLGSAMNAWRTDSPPESAAVDEPATGNPAAEGSAGDASPTSDGAAAVTPPASPSVEHAEQVSGSSAPSSAAPATDAGAEELTRAASVPAASSAPAPAAPTEQQDEDRPRATAGTRPDGPAGRTADSSVAAEQRDYRPPDVPAPTPVASSAATNVPTQQPAPVQQASLPSVSGARSLPGVSSTLPAVQPYIPPPRPPAAGGDASARRADAPPPRDDAALVRATIDGYRRAYNSLDAGAAARVWPTVDAAALGRAFRQLRSQSVTFDRCTIDIGGELARVECAGRSEWVAGVGDRSPRSAERTWHFDLSRADRGWTIVRVNVSQ